MGQPIHDCGECSPIFHRRCVFTYYNIMINWHDYGWMQLEIIRCSFAFHNMASIMLWIFLIDFMIFKVMNSGYCLLLLYYGIFFWSLDPCLICLPHIIFSPTNQGWVWENLTQIHYLDSWWLSFLKWILCSMKINQLRLNHMQENVHTLFPCLLVSEIWRSECS
jgi:hypothetical protein